MILAKVKVYPEIIIPLEVVPDPRLHRYSSGAAKLV